MISTNLQNRSDWIKGIALILGIIIAPGTETSLRAQTAMQAAPPETALAGSGTARGESPWYARTNPAAIGDTPTKGIFASFSPSSIGIDGYHEGAAVAILPIDSTFRCGATATMTGVRGFEEMEGSVIAAYRPTPLVTIGIGVGLHSLRIDGYGSAMAPVIDLGAVARLSEEIRFGGTMNNVTRARIAGADLPQRVAFGFAFDLGGETILSVDAMDELRRSASISIGLSVSPLAGLTLRGGIANGPGMIGLGVGYVLNDITLDYGGAYITPLGFRHVIGAGTRF